MVENIHHQKIRIISDNLKLYIIDKSKTPSINLKINSIFKPPPPLPSSSMVLAEPQDQQYFKLNALQIQYQLLDLIPKSWTRISILDIIMEQFYEDVALDTELELLQVSRLTLLCYDNCKFRAGSSVPTSVKYLALISKFNNPLPLLPDSVKTLVLDSHFNQPIHERDLPTSLKKLQIFNHNYPYLPSSLSQLNLKDLAFDFTQQNSGGNDRKLFQFPQTIKTFSTSTLQYLTSNNNMKSQLKSIENLNINDPFDEPLTVGIIPDQIQKLVISSSFRSRIELGALPSKLTCLKLYNFIDQPIEPGLLPQTLTYLSILGKFNHPIKFGSLPPNLTYLRLGDSFNQPIQPGLLPDSLQFLRLGYRFNYPLVQGSLPPSLTHFTFQTSFQPPLQQSTFPKSLTHLILGVGYIYDLKDENNNHNEDDNDDEEELVVEEEEKKDLEIIIQQLQLEQKSTILPKHITRLQIGNNFQYEIRNLELLIDSLEHLSLKNIDKKLIDELVQNPTSFIHQSKKLQKLTLLFPNDDSKTTIEYTFPLISFLLVQQQTQNQQPITIKINRVVKIQSFKSDDTIIVLNRTSHGCFYSKKSFLSDSGNHFKSIIIKLLDLTPIK
eukprot:gene5752-7155_t